MITQICVVVRDVRQANANWARILGVPEATVELSVNHQADNTDVIQKLLNGMSLPLDELR
jgi:hypothetical protein